MSKVISTRSTLAGIAFSLIALPVAAEETIVQTLSDMVSKGTVGLNFRYRYEYVDQDGFSKDAKASTLRTRLFLQSAKANGFDFEVEFSNVSYIGDDDFNSTDNGETQFPVVADPKGTEVNQAWLRYSLENANAKYGRQRINLGNQRFVGGVGWRQNEQTYDGIRGQWNSSFGLNADYSYIYKVNRIFGPDDGAQPASWDGNINLLRLDYKLLENHSIVGFAYLLDIDERNNYSPNLSVNNSTDTYGAQYSGKFGPLSARLGYAWQTDAGDSDLNYEADYYVAEVKLAIAGVTGQVGYEVLGSDNGVGFKTPLATLHKFQGWADKFLVTPADGIEDLYVGVSGSIGPIKLLAVYHDFQSEQGSEDLGTELDIAATWPIDKKISVQLKYADFDGDDNPAYQDTQKAWLTVSYAL
ncbi:MAG: alginate export family protein [Pseudomonadota bacterium]